MRLNIFQTIAILLISSISAFGGVDLILNSFEDRDSATKELQTLKEFAKENGVSAAVSMGEREGIYYLKVGPFKDNIRDDEAILAVFAKNYPALVVMEHRDQNSRVRVSNENLKSKKSFFANYNSLLQWLVMIIMTLWAGLIIYLRFKATSKVKNEQRRITREQTDMELNLKNEGL